MGASHYRVRRAANADNVQKTSHDGVLNLAGSLHWMYSGPFCGSPPEIQADVLLNLSPGWRDFSSREKFLSPNWSYFLSREKSRATFSACTIGQDLNPKFQIEKYGYVAE